MKVLLACGFAGSLLELYFVFSGSGYHNRRWEAIFFMKLIAFVINNLANKAPLYSRYSVFNVMDIVPESK